MVYWIILNAKATKRTTTFPRVGGDAFFREEKKMAATAESLETKRENKGDEGEEGATKTKIDGWILCRPEG